LINFDKKLCFLLFAYGPDYFTRSTVSSQCFAVTRTSIEHGSAGWQWNTGSQFLEICYHGNLTKGPLRAEEGYVHNVLLQGTDSRINLLNSWGTKKNAYVVRLKLCKTSIRNTVYRFPCVQYQPTALLLVTNFISIYLNFFPVYGTCISVLHEFNSILPHFFPSLRNMHSCMSGI